MTELKECNSRNIPQPIQREVRQRCGFGCVLCGMPLYEYEHMEGWARVKQHVASEITLLCDRHHREKTNGLLPEDAVRRANASPHNMQTGVSKPYNLHFSGKRAEILIGSNSFTTDDRGGPTYIVPISIDEMALVYFAMADGHLLLNVQTFDRSNTKVLHIKNNQLVYSISPWDIALVGTTLTIREAHRRILLEIQFEPPGRITLTRGRMMFNGVELVIGPDGARITNTGMLIADNHVENCFCGLVLGNQRRIPPALAVVADIPRYPIPNSSP